MYISVLVCGGVTGAMALGAEVRSQLQKPAQFFHIIVR